MAGFDLKVLHNNFPDLPLKAVEFFHPDNAPVEANNMKPRSVFEFAKHVEIKNPESSSSGSMPKWQLLNKICKILVEYDVLIDLGGGGPYGWKETYLTNTNDNLHVKIAPFLNYIVYGFPVIFDDYRHSILPIIRTDEKGDRAVGTGFIHTDKVIITAAHCIKGAAGISIKGISEEEWKGANILVSKNTALDLCALIFATNILPSAKRLPTGNGDILDEVMVVGYPNVPGFTELIAVEKAAISSRITVSKGAVASRATEYFSGAELFLITAPVRPGFSGGPVIRDRGEVVGVVSRLPDSKSESEIYQNLRYGTAIPSVEIKRLFLALKEEDETLIDTISCNSIEYVAWPESDLGADEAQPDQEEV